jgi:hypothetical protein
LKRTEALGLVSLLANVAPVGDPGSLAAAFTARCGIRCPCIQFSLILVENLGLSARVRGFGTGR